MEKNEHKHEIGVPPEMFISSSCQEMILKCIHCDEYFKYVKEYDDSWFVEPMGKKK